MSQGAHTTLDSYLKHKALHNKTFDVVVIYHGINEVRANNSPPEIFKPDYSHYAWYELRYLDDRYMPTINISIIPIIGSWVVWLPVGIFLLIDGQTFSAIFLLLYGAIFVSTIDNIIRPYILSRQSDLPIALSVIGTIGGLYFFGIAGILLGPLILAYVLIIIEFYKEGKLKDLFNRK